MVGQLLQSAHWDVAVELAVFSLNDSKPRLKIMNSFENPEDTKLATLASATLKRSGAEQAAALRDTTGRTYVAINIETNSLQLNALEAVFTVALASQITGIESVVYTGEITAPTQLIREYAPRATIFYLSLSGDIVAL